MPNDDLLRRLDELHIVADMLANALRELIASSIGGRIALANYDALERRKLTTETERKDDE